MTGRAARVVAQAKINLGLRILARERSGFHGIETIFARLALGDEVTVRTGGRERIVECRGADTGPGGDAAAGSDGRQRCASASRAQNPPNPHRAPI